jgi:hypothetical protein
MEVSSGCFFPGNPAKLYKWPRELVVGIAKALQLSQKKVRMPRFFLGNLNVPAYKQGAERGG